MDIFNGSEINNETKKILGAAGVLILILAGVYYYVTRNKLSENLAPQPSESAALVATAMPEVSVSAELLVGGDKDEFGCIGSAGYSWCAAKKKCIRVFEEDCNIAEEIKAILAPKYSLKSSEIFIDINYENTKYASGGISFGQKGAEGGLFLAAKVNDKWTIIYDGIGSIDCVSIKKNYEFTKEMLAGFCD